MASPTRLVVWSWNVNGLGNKIKRTIVLQHIKRHRPDIVLLQETHLMGNTYRALDRFGYRLIAHSGFTSGARGVGILLRTALPATLLDTWTDNMGGYVAVALRWEGRVLCICSCYIPPGLHKTFYPRLSSLLTELPEGTLLFGGDMNAVMHADMDRSGHMLHDRGERGLAEFTDTLGLMDIWREHNRQQRQYTFYSARHGTGSRIDYLFTRGDQLSHYDQPGILARGISDHSPIAVTMRGPPAGPRGLPKIDAWHFHDREMVEQLKEGSHLYFEENRDSVQSHITLWEAYKTVFRGQAQALIGAKKKEEALYVHRLEDDILGMEQAHGENPSAELRHRLQLKQKELRARVENEARAYALATQHRLYDVGDKSLKLLAWLERRHRERTWVTGVRDKAGTLVTSSVQMAELFAVHFEDIYSPISTRTEKDCEEFLHDFKLPILTAEQVEQMDAAFTKEEIEGALLALKSGKAPGPNGLPVELYKRQASIITPPLLQMYEEAREQGRLPLDQREATIVVIHKPGKPTDQCSSYRPISLINMEAKVLAKVLAGRLVRVLPELIHTDQSGFMPRRSTRHNLRRLQGVLYMTEGVGEVETALMALDASMAFDSIEWSYLFMVLEKFGFGPRFCSWVRLLYEQPLAKVRVNGIVSRTFSLRRGTRQGCPLSPLLFALALEPLAHWVRRDAAFWGLASTDTWEEHISLYADDVLLYMARPYHSIARILHIFDLFGSYSGYSINWGKSVIYPLSGPIPQIPSRCPAILAVDGFTYLGIYITRNISAFFQNNLIPLVRKFASDVSHWRGLPLSLMGRAALFKMLALPRFLYVMQNTPYPIPADVFKSIRQEVSKLLWDGGIPRIAQHKLTKGVYDGGIALPDIRLYYWASQLQVVNDWVYTDTTEPAYRVDRSIMPQGNYEHLLYTKTIKSTWPAHTKVVIRSWKEANKYLGWTDKLTEKTPLWVGDALKEVASLTGFKGWKLIGIDYLEDVWRGSSPRSFAYLQREYDMRDTQLFQHTRLTHALRAHIPSDVSIPSYSPLEDRLLLDPILAKPISTIYRKLINNMPDPLTRLKETWEADIGDLEECDWQEAVQSPRLVAIRPRFRLIQLKILHRVYYPRSRLYSWGRADSPLCLRGCKEEATFYHMLWDCPELVVFWSKITDVMSIVTGQPVPRDPRWLLLMVKGDQRWPPHTERWLALAAGVAKRNIARTWGAQGPPNWEQWRKDLDWCQAAEETIYASRGCTKKWEKIWGPWRKYRGL